MKKKLSVISLLMAMLIVVGGLTSSVSARSRRTTSLGTYKITAYCGCKSCSGKWGTRTASGRQAKQGRTIAVDRKKIKLGTKIKINGHTYIAEDVGSKVKGKHIDVYFRSHTKAQNFGKRYLTVYAIK